MSTDDIQSIVSSLCFSVCETKRQSLVCLSTDYRPTPSFLLCVVHVPAKPMSRDRYCPACSMKRLTNLHFRLTSSSSPKVQQITRLENMSCFRAFFFCSARLHGRSGFRYFSALSHVLPKSFHLCTSFNRFINPPPCTSAWSTGILLSFSFGLSICLSLTSLDSPEIPEAIQDM